MCMKKPPAITKIVICRFPSKIRGRDYLTACRDSTEAYKLMRELIAQGFIDDPTQFSWKPHDIPSDLPVYNYHVLLEVDSYEE